MRLLIKQMGDTSAYTVLQNGDLKSMTHIERLGNTGLPTVTDQKEEDKWEDRSEMVGYT
jgi:hypothetical protein